MSFDSSRFTFDPWKDFSGVVMEQGRVQLDSDWNEWLAELARRIRADTLDTLGRAVYPSTTPDAFLITPTSGSFTIGVGRMYVDGLLAENHGAPAPNSGGWIPPAVTASSTQPMWDPALDELVGQNPLDYTQQPYFPSVSKVAPFPTSGGPFLVYLDVWRREITFLEYPDLIEKAVGVDSAGRMQTVWQVKLLDISSAGSVTCTTPDSGIGPWQTLIQPSAGRLTTGVVQSFPSGPCCLAPNTGYTGLENQLYRVEIHQSGTSSSSPAATFKWSRDNASVATPVTGIAAGATVLTVLSTGKDSVLRFSANDWVEITDDWLELTGQPGELHQIAIVTDSANTIQLKTAVSSGISSGSFPVNAQYQTNPTRHTRLIRWNSAGAIAVPAPGTTVTLENGITVSFNLNPSTGQFNSGDFWTFAARTIDGTVENLVEAPPRAIHHHYARLALLTLPGSATDCRTGWPPSGGGCDCASCVSADSHNSGSWTIQDAVDAVEAQGGGKVCLGPGVYNIANMIDISATQGLAVSGHGLPTLVPTSSFSDDGIMLIEAGVDIQVEGIAFSGGASNSNAGAGLILRNSAFIRVQECAFGLSTDTSQLSYAIALTGNHLLLSTIRGNVFENVALGIAFATTNQGFLLEELEIEDNQMSCTDGAVYLTVFERFVATGIRFAKNLVQSTSGFVLSGQGIGATIVDNSFSIAAATAGGDTDPYPVAIQCNLSDTIIANNAISLNTGTLTITNSRTTGLPAGTYIWAVTAVDATGREILITSNTTFALSSPSTPTLTWTALSGAASYKIYRSVANGSSLLLDATVPASSAPSYNDTVPDSGLQNQAPALLNGGIRLAGVKEGAIISGTRIMGNCITDLLDTGILVTAQTKILAAVISNNQLQNLSGNGIIIDGVAVDLDITHNSLLGVGTTAATTPVAGIGVGRAITVNVSDNQIEVVGPSTKVANQVCAGLDIVALDARIAGNLISDIGPAGDDTTLSVGIMALCVGRFDVSDNEVRRATTPPTTFQQSPGLAILGTGFNTSVQGNLFESFGDNESLSKEYGHIDVVPGTAVLFGMQSCLFSNNECSLDNPTGDGTPLVVMVSAPAIIAMGNFVQGPPSRTKNAVASMSLILPPSPNPPPVTAIGNITTNTISITPGGMPAAMAPLNVSD